MPGSRLEPVFLYDVHCWDPNCVGHLVLVGPAGTDIVPGLAMCKVCRRWKRVSLMNRRGEQMAIRADLISTGGVQKDAAGLNREVRRVEEFTP